MEENTIKKPTIKEWTDDDKPREKLLRIGAGGMSEAELLAILIGSGNTEEDAVQLMRRILDDCGKSLTRLGQMEPEELCQKYKGIGIAKAVTIVAACELGKRRQHEDVLQRDKIHEGSDIANYFRARMQDLAVEECHVLFLNHAYKVIGSYMLSRGGITRAIVDVREILRRALLAHATHIALCHNHPSGNVNPSIDDDRITEKVKNAAKTMDITLLDHVVFSDEGYYSYAEEGRL